MKASSAFSVSSHPKVSAHPHGVAPRGIRLFLSIAIVVILTVVSGHAATTYRPGDIVEDLPLIRRDTRMPIRWEELNGSIVFLEWFAWWCPFCQAAAPQVADGIVDWYRARGGNPDGIPVVHVAVNLQPNQEVQTQNFINRAGFSLVLEDFDRRLANRFQFGGQPIFAIINRVEGSPSHALGELLLHQDGYGQRDFSSSLFDFRAAMDAVRAAPRPSPPELREGPQGGEILEGAPFRFAVTAEGTGPLEYQWFHDGIPLPAATSAEWILPAVNLADAGEYQVRITNPAGSVTSDAVRLTVLPRMLPTPRLVELTRLPGGGWRVVLDDVAGREPWLESSTNLIAWVVAKSLGSGDARRVVEVEGPAESALFFRVRNQ